MAASPQLAVAFPLQVGEDGYTATIDSLAAAADQLIEELLFTDPGERLNQPGLGCGLIELVFDSLTDELVAATQFQISSRLQAWLADVIRVVSVDVSGSGPELDVTVVYQLAGTTRRSVFRR